MIINDLDGYYIVFDTKNWNTELDTLSNEWRNCESDETLSWCHSSSTPRHACLRSTHDKSPSLNKCAWQTSLTGLTTCRNAAQQSSTKSQPRASTSHRQKVGISFFHRYFLNKINTLIICFYHNVVIFDYLYRPFVVSLLTVTEWWTAGWTLAPSIHLFGSGVNPSKKNFVYTAHARNIRVSIIMGYIVFLTHY